jgi:hypothetical protein
VVLYDSRSSILNGYLCTINGLKVGIEFKNRFRTGAAIYFLFSGVPTSRVNPPDANPNSDGMLRFQYQAGYAEYVLFGARRWEVNGSTQLGLGSAYVYYEALNGDFRKTDLEFMGIIEPSLSAQRTKWPRVSRTG